MKALIILNISLMSLFAMAGGERYNSPAVPSPGGPIGPSDGGYANLFQGTTDRSTASVRGSNSQARITLHNTGLTTTEAAQVTIDNLPEKYRVSLNLPGGSLRFLPDVGRIEILRLPGSPGNGGTLQFLVTRLDRFRHVSLLDLNSNMTFSVLPGHSMWMGEEYTSELFLRSDGGIEIGFQCYFTKFRGPIDRSMPKPCNLNQVAAALTFLDPYPIIR